jgi:hypothetical protein
MSYITHTVSGSPRRGRFVVINVLVVVAALALVWMGRASAQSVWIGSASTDEDGPGAAATRSVSTTISKADAVESTGKVCTSSGSMVDMPDMLVSFKSGGTKAQAVIVLFQGEWDGFGTEVNGLQIELTVDGVKQGANSVDIDERELGGPDEAETHGFNFLSDKLAPGLHVARIQWSSPGELACVVDRSLIVLHK